MNQLIDKATGQLNKILAMQPHDVGPEVIEALLVTLKAAHAHARLFRSEPEHLGVGHLEQLQKLYFTQGVPARTTRLLMETVGCDLNDQYLKYQSTLHNVANPGVFFPLLVKQHLHLRDFSLYRFIPQLVQHNEHQLFLQLAKKYMGFDAATHPKDFTQQLCRWTYELSLACDEPVRMALEAFVCEHHEKLLAGLDFKFLIDDPLALGMAQFFKRLGLDALCARYAVAQRCWPMVMEHFVVMEELGHPMEDTVMAALTQSSVGSKRFAQASLYLHLSRPGSQWAGLDIPEQDQPAMMVKIANRLWKAEPALRQHIAATVNAFACTSERMADGLISAKLDAQIAKACDALYVRQLESDLGL
ncbi:hypothetical protein RBE51_21030 [Pseudomonas taiwanensis]|uniref:hypothetical protein n=1 Tax=Pseudomonas taiwanensis TaxID=470150 RepID=UPI0028DFC2FE|nr:hypothetical protein [Pseudomonas taiwanensis]MDT8925281.1 hypothetical protein [Pseudomonas taiwanensis]